MRSLVEACGARESCCAECAIQGWEGGCSGNDCDREMLVDDHDEMIVKALSWALRQLVAYDQDVVRRFLAKHDDVLASRVKREVTSKIETVLTNPRKRQRGT